MLESKSLFKYLQDNIIGLLLTLLAINTATLGLIASKIQDILIPYPSLDFSDVIKEMKMSLLEQIILIIVSIATLLVKDSAILEFKLKDSFCEVILVAVLTYSIYILWDTGKAVFITIEEIQNMNKKK